VEITQVALLNRKQQKLIAFKSLILEQGRKKSTLLEKDT